MPPPDGVRSDLRFGRVATARRDGEDQMKRQRSWKEYRAIDLTIMAVMLAVFEYLIIAAARFWFPNQLYTASLAASVTSIVYMRWSWWGAIPRWRPG